jgi:hypothetical protein
VCRGESLRGAFIPSLRCLLVPFHSFWHVGFGAHSGLIGLLAHDLYRSMEGCGTHLCEVSHGVLGFGEAHLCGLFGPQVRLGVGLRKDAR